MEELIKQAFLHVDVIGPHVQQGHYDLLGPDQEIILPQVWERVVEPDWSITMHMWPMDQRPHPHGHPMGGARPPPPGAIPMRPGMPGMRPMGGPPPPPHGARIPHVIPVRHPAEHARDHKTKKKSKPAPGLLSSLLGVGHKPSKK